MSRITDRLGPILYLAGMFGIMLGLEADIDWEVAVAFGVMGVGYVIDREL